MRLLKLEIELEKWGPKKGAYTGTASFSGEPGVVQLHLNEHHIDEIFRTCGDSMIEVAKAAARHLTMAVIEQKKFLEETK